MRRRLAGALVLTALVSLILAAVVGTGLIRRAEEQAALTELRRQAERLGGEASLTGEEPLTALRLVRRALDLSDASLYRIAPNRAVLVGGEPQFVLTDADLTALRSNQTLEGRRQTGNGEAVFVAAPISAPRSKLVLVLSRPVQQGPRIPLGPSGLAAAALAVGAATGMALVLSKRISEPMGELAAAADDVAKGNLDRRVAVDGEDEIAVVAEAFNSMAAQLKQNEQRQKDFLMSISHELRTPLTAIQGYAEAIEDGTIDGQDARAAGVIVGESKRLGRLVSDLLDLARLDAHRFSVRLEPVEVASILDAVQSKFMHRAEGVDLEIDPCVATAQADPDRLVQVLSNLMENALRYTPAGGRIRLGCSETSDRVVFEVTDSGPGFQDQDLPRAFERQYLWTRYRAVRQVGTGLGLVITKELVLLMGGSIEASNVPGGGAMFTVSLTKASEQDGRGE